MHIIRDAGFVEQKYFRIVMSEDTSTYAKTVSLTRKCCSAPDYLIK